MLGYKRVETFVYEVALRALGFCWGESLWGGQVEIFVLDSVGATLADRITLA